MFADYRPNEYFRATKNASYWNQPYPYLDEIEFRPIPDALNRRDALLSGSIDLLHSTNGEVITGSVTTMTTSRRRSTTTPRSATRCST